MEASGASKASLSQPCRRSRETSNVALSEAPRPLDGTRSKAPATAPPSGAAARCRSTAGNPKRLELPSDEAALLLLPREEGGEPPSGELKRRLLLPWRLGPGAAPDADAGTNGKRRRAAWMLGKVAGRSLPIDGPHLLAICKQSH